MDQHHDAATDGGSPTSGPGDPGSRSTRPRQALRRPVEDRTIAGVASGLARYLGVDNSVVRIAFVLLAVFGGSGLLLYIVGWIAIPEQQPGENVGGHHPARSTTPRVIIGVILIVIGAASLANRFLPALSDLTGPLLLIGVGALLLIGFARE